MNQNCLFVYGTLRKNYGLELMEAISDKFLFCGEGKVKATLYDLGTYPAAVAGVEDDEIKGDVYAVSDAVTVFAVLDEYEGDEYRREKTVVTIGGHRKMEAWMYWYIGQVEEEQRISEDDYLNYLKNKKDRLA